MTTPAIKAAGPMLVPILAKPFTQEFLNRTDKGLSPRGKLPSGRRLRCDRKSKPAPHGFPRNTAKGMVAICS
jgi:hypothetical protein